MSESEAMHVFYCSFESVLEVGGHGYYDFINRHYTYACLSQARTYILAGILRGRFVLNFLYVKGSWSCC